MAVKYNKEAFSKKIRGKMTYRARLMTQHLKEMLVMRDHVVTGKLHKSIKTKTFVKGDKLGLKISMADYGQWINRRNKSVRWKPPYKAIAEWAGRKGLKPKTKGKNAFKKMIFAIRNSMMENGFMYKDARKNKVGWLDEAKKDASKRFVEDFAIDFMREVSLEVESVFRKTLKDYKKK